MMTTSTLSEFSFEAGQRRRARLTGNQAPLSSPDQPEGPERRDEGGSGEYRGPATGFNREEYVRLTEVPAEFPEREFDLGRPRAILELGKLMRSECAIDDLGKDKVASLLVSGPQRASCWRLANGQIGFLLREASLDGPN